MAKSADGAGRSRKQRRKVMDDLSMVDARWLEQRIRETDQQSAPGDRESAVKAAQDLVSEASRHLQFDQRWPLVRQAIEICPEFAESFVCLAEAAPTSQDAEKFYRLGITAVETALGGPDQLAQCGNVFWNKPNGVSYLRARYGLAQTLWAIGQQDQAIQECHELLELNPDDYLEFRYLLGGFYGQTGQYDRWQQLLDRYTDDSVDWWFSQALLAFYLHGDASESRQVLQRAHSINPLVAAYLLGDRSMPDDQCELEAWMQDTAAFAYADESSSFWRSAPGALAWMRRTLRIGPPDSRRVARPSMQRLVDTVAELPQAEEMVWQVDFRRTQIGCPPDWDGPPPWALIITCPQQNDLLVLDTLDDERPAAKDVLIRLLETMANSGDDDPQRPETIQVRRKQLAKSWSPKLDKIGIECEWVEELDHVDHVMKGLQQVARVCSQTLQDLDESIDQIADLTIEPGEVWQADIRRLATWVTEDGVPRRPSAALVTSSPENYILAQHVCLEEPSPAVMIRTIAAAMLTPTTGAPHLPGAIEVCCDQTCQTLRARLEPLGVECRSVPVLQHLDFVYSELEQGLSTPGGMAALIDVPGVTLGHVAGFFDAAAQFYRCQPWRLTPHDRPLRIHCDRFRNNTWYAVVLGQSGLTCGLIMYEDLKLLKAMLYDAEEADRRQSGISVMFGEAFDLAIRDLDAAEKHDWPVASEEAYPLILRINPGMSMRPPLHWELELTEACLRAIPAFLRDTTKDETVQTVPTAAGNVEISLAWQR